MDATAQELIARLRRDPYDPEAFAALRAHYHRIGDYASLANLLEGWAGRAPNPYAGARALFDAGELVLGALADRERAIEIYERALALDPRHTDTFARLCGLFDEAGENRRLADLLERQAFALQQIGADPRDAALLCHQLGEIWEHRFSRVDKAVNYYRRAFDLDPTLVASIYAAREIYRSAGNMKAAATLLEKEAQAEVDTSRKAALWRELAHLRMEHLDDSEGATLALKRALSHAPTDLDVMTDLARVYLTRAERSEDPHVAASDRHRAADLLYQMAQQVATNHALVLLEQALDARPDHDGALSLYEQINEETGQSQRLPARWVAYLAHAPNGPESAHRRRRLADAYLRAGQVDYAITCLEWLLEDGDPEAAETLVGLYRQKGRHEDVIRALEVAVAGLPPQKRITRLRELIAALRDRGEIQGAGTFAVQLLEVEPDDPEALNLLEDVSRKTGDYEPLRRAMLAASRVSGLSAAQRKQRLKQVAQLSEKQLDDAEGAINAWRGVAALDATDGDARTSLKRLFTATERWDDLVELLEREALSTIDPEPKADIYRQLATIHEVQRGDLEAAIEARRFLQDLLPNDLEARDALCDTLVEAGAYLEAVPLLRQRVDEATGDARTELLTRLATILEERVGDEEGAFETWAMLLDENSNDLEALSRMIAIDEGGGRPERLLSTLSYKVEVIADAEKPGVLARMASVADGTLNDLDRAAELYARALELAPRDAGILDALCSVYDRAERFKDLVMLLREQARTEQDVHRRAELYRRIARTLAGAVGNEDGAAEAWREVLAAGEDGEALRCLRSYATRTGDLTTLEDVLARLSLFTQDDAERLELLLERGTLLADQLDRPHDAIVSFRKVVNELAPDHLGALERLAELCEKVGDRQGLADALWRQLDIVEDPGLRAPIARRLSDLHENVAPQLDRAVTALRAWADSDPSDPAPLRRLVPLLESGSRWAELTSSLDALAALEDDPAQVSKLVRRAAEVAYRQLGDVDGAWSRLESRVPGDGPAEVDLRELAKGAHRGEQLAALYVMLAQEARDSKERQRRWMEVASVHEQLRDDAEQALEAVLRAFAVDLSDRTYLDEADRLAERGNAWVRLGQVYETLIKRETTLEGKTELLLRHAARLDEKAGDVSAALDQTLRACSLSPANDEALSLAEHRAPRAGRAEELLIVYDKRRRIADVDAGRIDALLRSARWCEHILRNRQRTTDYLAQAVALTVRSSEFTETVEGTAAELDQTPGAVGGVRRAIVDIYATLAEDMDEDPLGGAALLMRAARLLSEELGNDPEAYAMLKRAATHAPWEEEVLNELDRFAHRLDRLEELDEHLAQLIHDALDNRTASTLLRRRGLLLEELSRFDDAADVWARLSNVTSGDPKARERLRACLRRSGKHQDLLIALQRDLKKTEDPAARLDLLRETARVWDHDLGNRWEAIEAWESVRAEKPNDDEANRALERLGQKRTHALADQAMPDAAGLALGVSEEILLTEELTELTALATGQAVVDYADETVLDEGLFRELSAIPRPEKDLAEKEDLPRPVPRPKASTGTDVVELHTGEIELLEEQTLDTTGDTLFAGTAADPMPFVQELGGSNIEELEEWTSVHDLPSGGSFEEIEELEELESIEEIPSSSVPPPPSTSHD